MILAFAPCPVGVYAPAHDRSVSVAGSALRLSIEEALAPPRPTRTDELLHRLTAALRSGFAEGFHLSASTFGRLADVLAALPTDIPLPEIVVESDRSVGMDWYEGSRRSLALTIDDTAFIGYSALIGHEPVHGRVPFAGQIPETVRYLLGRIYF